MKEKLSKALTELRKDKERKFDQTVDLIVNLQKFDVKKNQVNIFISVPHKIKGKKRKRSKNNRRQKRNKNMDTTNNIT